MNILLVCEIDFLKKVVYDVHLLPEAMSLRGHKVYVIDYTSMWKRDDKRMMKETIVSRALPNANVVLIRPSFIKLPVLSRASAFVTHYFEIGRVIKEKQIDAIILYSVPTNGLQAVYWAKKFGIPVIFRSLDILHQLVLYPILRPITKMMEKWVYSNVDMVLTITPKLSEYVVKMGADPRKVNYLAMPVDTNRFHPSSDTKGLRQKWGIKEDDQVVLYVGTLYKFSGLDLLIPQFRDISAKLLIVGDGIQRPKLESIINFYGLKRKVVITGFQPFEDMPAYINLADVCVNPFMENDITRDIFPGKTVQFLACGKPLVATDLPGMKAVITDECGGILYTKDTHEVVAYVKELLGNPELRMELGNKGLDYARKEHSCERIAKQLEGILERQCSEVKVAK